jgi:fatty-acyl-CoA synthase
MTNALSYASGPSETALLGETIGEMFDRIASHNGADDALVSVAQGIRWTYAELAQQVDRCARALIAAGIGKGDRVGIWSPNCAEWVVLQFATAKAGCILVNINPAYRVNELRYALGQSGCSLLVMAAGFRDADYRAILAEARPAGLETVVVLGPGWDEFLDAAEGIGSERLDPAALDLDDAINIQYTSGTTGQPKGATLSHHNILNNGFFIGETLAYTPADRVCIPVPFYHCFGMVLGTLAVVTHGACIVLPSEAFEPVATLEAVESERCSALYGVPTMFIAELGLPDFDRFDLSTLRTGIMAGSPCPIDVMRRVIDEMHMTEVTICYGMTESSPVSTQTRRDDPLEKRVGSVGQVHPHVEVKVVDPETGRTVPRGLPGELCTRGYSVMRGYWANDEATRETIDEAHWLHTGDLATMDDDGYLAIVGRIKDMIIRGGENVYPREVEELLYTHPDIQDVAVVGVPDERLGEEVCAWIVLRPGAQLDDETVRQFCRERVARPKVPRYVRFVDGFPLTVTGKIQKYLMREREIEERGLHAVSAGETA